LKEGRGGVLNPSLLREAKGGRLPRNVGKKEERREEEDA
jgi:hypothetical protein